jgi:hypothetical protein
MQLPTPQEAAQAYSRFLSAKSASPDDINLRLSTIAQLIPLIESISRDGAVYREKVDLMLEHTDKAQWPAVLQVIREYYYFWIGDIKAIASADVFEPQLTRWQSYSGSLQALWPMLNQEQFDSDETKALHAYATELRAGGADKQATEIRLKLAKILLLRLRGAESRNPKLYRRAADATLPIFELKELRYLFLQTIREFYQYWVQPSGYNQTAINAKAANE